MNLGLALDLAKKQKWALTAALILAILYYAGDTVVRCVAYFQPKVTVLTVEKKVIQYVDRSVRTTETVKLPDGTVKTLERLDYNIQSLTTAENRSENTRTPDLSGAHRRWLVDGLYLPVGRIGYVGAGYDFGLLQVGAGNQVYPWDGFQPYVRVTVPLAF